RRNQRDDSQRDVQRQKKDSSARHHEKVAGELDKRLREKHVQLVSIVVDARDEIPGFVLVEKNQWQTLQLRKQSIPQLEKHGTANGTHRQRLKVTGKKAAQVNTHQNRRERENTGEVPGLNVRIDRVTDDDRPQQRGTVCDKHGHKS